VGFTKSFAPVLNDVSFRLMLISKLVWDMTSTVVDIETSFLHGNLDKEIYMDVPMGLSIVQIVRYNGMHNHSILFTVFIYFNLEFQGKKSGSRSL
jgi:hypothetical protein